MNWFILRSIVSFWEISSLTNLSRFFLLCIHFLTDWFYTQLYCSILQSVTWPGKVIHTLRDFMHATRNFVHVTLNSVAQSSCKPTLLLTLRAWLHICFLHQSTIMYLSRWLLYTKSNTVIINSTTFETINYGRNYFRLISTIISKEQ